MQKVIERILNLLAFLLTVGRPVTADEIRNTVQGYDQPSDEAFRRTFERDKDLLRSLGVPLELEYTDIWQVELGYVVPSDDYVLDDPGLTDEEQSALLFAAQAVRFGGQITDMGAIFKLGGASPTLTAGPIVADLGYDLDLLGDLFGAVTQRRIVRFSYRDRGRTTLPYGLVHRFGHWYLIGPEQGDDTVKAFRVDRMVDLHTDDVADAFERPRTFDPRTALAGVTQDPQQRTARIRFDNDVVGVAINRSRASAIIEQDGATTLVEVPIGSVQGLISWLIGFDDRALIEGPPDIRDAFLAFVEGDR
jgi:proteasome accessory factor B